MNVEIEKGQKGAAVIVGASLSGLMSGIALAQEGVQVTIVEKVGEHRIGGSGLRVDGGTFGRSKTEKLLKQLVSGGKSSVQLWASIESRLREAAKQDDRIKLRYNTRIVEVEQDANSAWVVTDQEERVEGDLLIGADGHNSQVRKYVSPDKPNATYAGYMGWLASIDENDLPESLRPAASGPSVEMFDSYDGFKFGSIIEREDKSSVAGSRRIGCTWYDNKRSGLLRQLGCVEGMVVFHSLNGQDIPEQTLRELEAETAGWPEPWRFAARHAIRERTLIGIPIKEYVPNRLAKGRIALVGDAAHVPAPVTASGFNESLQDAVALGRCAENCVQGQAAVQALEEYESLRLEKVRRMVQSGQFYSRSFGRP
ncbi:FAD-dependent oxidoreductase [Sporosarcina cyprini]|uniref:FAD-dependent oxidoreductase n=1 Tax=Sporosarcina cyprini TaxID=2910523 RepID=UPI001EDD7A7D|nr:NAD(P)/FAD-dependent oxidoreductase [Sporosarcina cyprini]MCG3087789.1 FAD-dependent monooxygenase [Sporosarcina cyprini]